MPHASVFDILHPVLLRTAGLSASDLAEKLVVQIFDPHEPDPEMTRLVVKCEEVLEADCQDDECNARIMDLWKTATALTVVAAVSEWAEREFPSAP